MKGATEAIRQFAGTQRDPGLGTVVNPTDPRTWPPPQHPCPAGAADGTCTSCRT